MQKYHVHSLPAIIGGSLSALGSCALLMADVGSLANLTVDKALMPVLVGLTVLTGHLAWQAWAELKLFSCAGLFVVSSVGVALTVTDAMGRRAEVRDSGVRLADDAESRRAALTRKRDEAVEILGTHRQARDRECATGKGKLCDGKSYTVSTWEAAVAGYEAQLLKLPAPRPVDAKGQRVGAIAGMVGLDGKTAQARFALLEPFMLPALLELASIVLFGFGVGHVRVAENAAVATVATVGNPLATRFSADSIPQPLPTAATQAPIALKAPAATVKVSDEDRVLDALRSRGGQIRSQNDLGIVLGRIHKSEVSKMLKNCPRVEKIYDPISKCNIVRIKDVS
mgnify:CR=1 FL=1